MFAWASEGSYNPHRRKVFTLHPKRQAVIERLRSSCATDMTRLTSCNVRVALYSAGSGKPGSLLAESASTAMTTAAGWQDIPVTSYSATAGTYWIAIQLSSTKSVYYQSGSRSWYTRSFGAFDSSWSGSSRQDSAAQWNMRVTYVGALYGTNTNVPSASFYGLATRDFRLAIYSDALGPSGKFLE